jgi:acyl carrier protein
MFLVVTYGLFFSIYTEDKIMYQKLKLLLVEELQIDEADITPEAKLSADLGINSIELADLVMLCEDKFGIEIKDDDIHNFITVSDVVNYLESVSK